MGPGASLSRRALLLLATAVAGCEREPPAWEGGWVGAAHDRGHRLREAARRPEPSVQRRASVIVVGGGIAGLACARTLVHDGIDDVHLFELEDVAGGNSRGHVIGGVACPLGAHYLPVPGPHAHEVTRLLEELGLARFEAGRWRHDERHLCHSPQERLFIDGAWHDGLLPPGKGATLDAYRRFAGDVARAQRELGFAMPTHRAPWTRSHEALDAQTFAAWLDAAGFDDARLRDYLDYCCRDDYGAGIATVSAWAGLHYFASRHGFHAPGDGDGERELVFTWPQGNAWLVQRMTTPLADRIHAACTVLRVSEGRHDATVDLWNDELQRHERWIAKHVVLAVPLFVAARVLDAPAAALTEAAKQLRYAPWLVANLRLDRPLLDRPGAPPSWDNVIHGSRMLGYVDAMHQSTRPHPGATVLTAYWALRTDQRAALLERPWRHYAQAVIDELSIAHPDLPRKVKRVDLMRYGHAMSIPAPGVRGSAALQALADSRARVHYAHADLSGYSVFEEAYTHGVRVARRVSGTRD
jgi:predicted NAD/FAD-binding protein